MTFELLARRFFSAVCAATILSAVTAQAAALVVTNTNDNLAGSLRQAIQDASPDASPGDTITFQIPTTDAGYDSQSGRYSVLLTSGALNIDKSLTIDGGGQKIVIARSSTQQSSIFSIFGGDVVLSGLSIEGGSTRSSGGGLSAQGDSLTLRSCTFRGNVSESDGGAVYYRGGSLNVENCTFFNNTAGGTSGGGAIFSLADDLTVHNSTIFGNSATEGTFGRGGGICVGGTSVRIMSTIIVGNSAGAAGPDVAGTVVSEGYNLIGNTAGSSGFGSTGDQLGATLAQVNLALLGHYGGPTETMPPRRPSLAIDQGKTSLSSNGAPLSTDQRGLPRVVDRPEFPNANGGDGSDIGAIEAGRAQDGSSFTVTSVNEQNDGECRTDLCTLMDAIDASNADADASVINFALNQPGPISTSRSRSGLRIVHPVTINGPGARALALSGLNTGRILDIAAGAGSVNVSGLAFIDGVAPTGSYPTGFGGAILNAAILNLTDCEFSYNSAQVHGGAIFNDGTTGSGAFANLKNCFLYRNHAAQSGGAIFSQGSDGRIANVSLTNCTVLDNHADQYGGALYSDGANSGSASANVKNCTFAENSAGIDFPCIVVDGQNPNTSGFAELVVGNTIFYSSSSGVSIRSDGGTITSQGHNLASDAAGGDPTTTGPGGLLNGAGDRRNTDPGLGPLATGNFGGPTVTLAIQPTSPAIDAGDDSLAPPKDQRGRARNGQSDVGAYEYQGLLAVTLANISTRLAVQAGDNVLIGGFIVTGEQQKGVIVRALGPSLPVNGTLADPILQVYNSVGTLLAENDNWRTNSNAADIENTGVAPTKDAEAAILRSLAPGTYTAVERGPNGGTGVGLLEVYDLDRTVDSKLANISTRGVVQTGDDVMIGGFIVLGIDPQKVIVRALGPSLPVNPKLPNPKLELRDQNGALVRANDDWRSDQQTEIDATGIPPSNNLEAALVATLPPAAYTAVVRDANGASGIGLVEIYGLQ
jgi:predicted outer membrane repeat protein